MLSKLRSAVSSHSFPAWSVPVALLALTVLAYGLRARSLGLYWDDLPYLWLYQRLGADGIVRALSEDRPFLSFLYTTSFRLLGETPVVWQGYALLWRWLCSVSFWWMLAQAWPGQTQKTALAAALFAVYPGFTQQWIAMIYGQAFALYTPVFASIAITLWLARSAARRPRWNTALLSGAALALSAFSMFSTEYFFGLELLRPLLLVLLFTSTAASLPFWRGVLRAALWWLPYLILMIVFVIWRAFFQVFPGHGLTVVEGLRVSFGRQLLALATTILGDMLEATIAAWGQVLALGGLLEGNPSAGLRLLLVIGLTALLAWIYFSRLRQTAHNKANWAAQALLVGLLALLVGGWPFWITGLPMRLGFPQDRYTLPLAPGAALLLAGGVDWLGGQNRRKAAAVALLLGLAAGFHNTTALQYRAEWNEMRSLFWQLSWRAPTLQPDTLLVVDGLPFQFYEDDSLLGLLNWMYDPDNHSGELSLALFDLQVRFQDLAERGSGAALEKEFRGTRFRGSTAQVIALSHQPGGCWTILDAQYDAQNYQLTDRLLRVLPLSQPSRWIGQAVSPPQPPQPMFGMEPEHDWCYFFARAGLARQEQDWAAVYELGEASIDKGIRPRQPVEYLPFIEGYLRYGLADDAYQLTMDAYSLQYNLRPALCAVWQRSQQAGSVLSDPMIANLRAAPGCTLTDAETVR